MKRVLVTGTGHSGTTFVARLLMELGCDFGQRQGPADWTEGPHAMEWPPLAKAADSLLDEMGRWPAPNLYQALRPETKHTLSILIESLPPFIKNPTVGHTLRMWLELGLELDAIIYVHRDVQATAESIHKAVPSKSVGKWMERCYATLGRLAATAFDHQLKMAVVRYPVCVRGENAVFMFDDLQPFIPQVDNLERFKAAHQATANPELVHVRNFTP